MPGAPKQQFSYNIAEFSQEVAKVRAPLRGYLFSLLLNEEDAADALQETLIFLWEKRGTFSRGTSFRAWAFKTAYFKALDKRREQKREKLTLSYSDSTFEIIAAKSEFVAEKYNERLDALLLCINELPAGDAVLLQTKYAEHGALTTLSKKSGLTRNTLYKAFSRIRLRLKQCVEKRLQKNNEQQPSR